MERFEIEPVRNCTLPEVARFLYRQSGDRDPAVPQRGRGDAASIERRLRWLLLENPAARDGSSHGFFARDCTGAVRGLTLSFPGAFLAGDQRFFGLCSGSFFVEPEARTLGFYLFKNYLRSPDYAFFFATTCNANSAALWGKLGGCAVPNSELEYVLPLRLDALLAAFVAGTASRGVAQTIACMFGRCGNPILRFLERRKVNVVIEPSRDWEKLSALFHRHRPKDRITADRSAKFLQWRYGQSSDRHPAGVYLFRDKRGNEGWFSLGNMTRGLQGQIRGCVVLDAVWPQGKMSFSDIFPSILSLAADSDAIFFRPRLGVDTGECGPWIIRRKWAAPSTFVIVRRGEPRLMAASLDLVCADGDSALPISPVSRLQAVKSEPCVVPFRQRPACGLQ